MEQDTKLTDDTELEWFTLWKKENITQCWQGKKKTKTSKDKCKVLHLLRVNRETRVGNGSEEKDWKRWRITDH